METPNYIRPEALALDVGLQRLVIRPCPFCGQNKQSLVTERMDHELNTRVLRHEDDGTPIYLNQWFFVECACGGRGMKAFTAAEAYAGWGWVAV